MERKLFGLTFPNPVGLAAGFDKDAKLFQELSQLWFWLMEIGTLTPNRKTEIQKKECFVAEDEGLINRMGFNNEGVDAAVKR